MTKFIFSLLLSLFSIGLLHANGSQQSLSKRFLKTNGTLIRDAKGTGNIVDLKGTNLGGWLLREGWMDPIGYDYESEANTLDDYTSRKIMIQRFGEQTTDKLLDAYQKIYIKESDLDYIKSAGLNFVRVPFFWMEILDTLGNIKKNAFRELDWVVKEAEKRSMYVLLDLHGAPGGHSDGYQTGGHLGSNKLWTNKTYQAWTIKIWQTIARRYKENPTVLGYDLLNEPVAEKGSGMKIVDMYDILYKAVREIDQDHIIFMGAFYSFDFLCNPREKGWENVVYQTHPYGADQRDNHEVQQQFMYGQLDYLRKYRNLWNIPVYPGEFCFWLHYDLWEIWLFTLTDEHFMWSNWAYKNIECSEINNWGFFTCNTNERPDVRRDSKEEILSKWEKFSTSHYVKNDRLYDVIKRCATKETKMTEPKLGAAPLEDVIGAMTLDEKIKLLIGGELETSSETSVIGNTEKEVPGAAGTTFAIPRLGIPSIVMADGPAGVRIDTIRNNDSKKYYCTAFPIATSLASTWNTPLVETVGKAMGAEAKEYGIDLLLAPALNIQRDPLCGRNFEYYSEDPMLSGKMAASMVKGIQYNNVGTSLKHFAMNNQETNRMSVNANANGKAIREIYLKGFEMAVKEASPWTVMSSYNYINGTFASESYDLLTTILRDEWKFDGTVITDWFGGSNASKQVKAGNDLLMPGRQSQYQHIKDAIESGELSITDINRNVANILRLIQKTNKFKNYKYSNSPDLDYSSQIVKESALEGMVLLKNNHNALPFSHSTRKVSAYGVASYDFMGGGTGSGNVNSAHIVSLIEGLRNNGLQLSETLLGLYNQHIVFEKERVSSPSDNPLSSFFSQARISEYIPDKRILQKEAQLADAAIITIGRSSGEFADRKIENDFLLTEKEHELISAVSKIYHQYGKPVIVLLNIGGAVETASWKDMPDGILVCWQAGIESGNAVGELLVGKKSPSGKLPMTFPLNYLDTSSSKNFPHNYIEDTKDVLHKILNDRELKDGTRNVDYVDYEEDCYVGYRYYDATDLPVSYPFGFGLSYTSFEYAPMEIREMGDTYSISVKITNRGNYSGKEVAQLYISGPDNLYKELKAFAKTKELKAGETETVELRISKDMLARFDESSSSWITPGGAYDFYIGASVTDIKTEKRIYLNEGQLVEEVHPVLLPQKTIKPIDIVKITDLRVQGLSHPLAIEDAKPTFSWRMEADKVGQKQLKYHIVVHDENGREMWNSGEILSSLSANIEYEGLPLKPECAYTWTLEVTDADGIRHTRKSEFETGLMNRSTSAWDGAKFIGSKEVLLDAVSHNYFEIDSKFRIIEGGRMSLVFGADDFRFKDGFQNDRNICGENYFRMELDLTGAGKEDGARLAIYRKGFEASDNGDMPIVNVSKAQYPQTNINSIFTADNAKAEHRLQIFVETSNIHFIIDGVDLMTEPVAHKEFDSGFAVGHSALKSSNATRFLIGIWGHNHDYNTLPNLNSVGFAALPGSKVIYTDYRIKNCGHSENNVAFDHRHYDIFNSLDHVSIQQSHITVDNLKGNQMAVEYANPSHGGLTLLRTTFETKKRIAKARLYATAMGGYQLYLNGSQVNYDWFAPGDSQFREILGYYVYDVTNHIVSGRNCLAAQLVPAWYTGYMTFMTNNFNFFGDNEALMAKLIITYEDSTRQTIVTGPRDWTTSNEGPVRYGSFFNGERYDANREISLGNWKESDYNDSHWKKPSVISSRPWVRFGIQARYDEPVKARETFTAQKVMPVHSNDLHTYIYNMGTNIVGVPSITIPEGWLQKGDTVIIRYAEQLYPGVDGDATEYIDRFGTAGKQIAGRPLFENLRAALCTDMYIANGSGPVTICPTSTYRGYQYVQITIPSSQMPLPLGNVKGIVLSSDKPSKGLYHATTSDNNVTANLANQLFLNIQRSQLGNFFTIPTDCPQRNERMGWTGDAQAYVRTATYNSDVQNFFRQWMVSLRADQGIGDQTTPAGGIGSTVPTYNTEDETDFADGTTWAAAICMVPWQLYIQYGNKQVIRDNFDAMIAWLNGMDFFDYSSEYPHLSSKTTGLADWLAMDDNTPPDLVNNAIYIYMIEATATMADAIGKHEQAEILRERHKLAKEEWNKLYADAASGRTKDKTGRLVHSQSSYATPLNFNCFNDSNQKMAIDNLARLVQNPSASGDGVKQFPPYTITTGFSGTPNILPALSKFGQTEDAYRLFTSTDYTSWLYPVTKGATSIWERWNGYEAAFSESNDNNMNSFNHFALGAVGQWMYEYQLGITNGSSGYKNFILQPSAGSNYTSLYGCYESNYGIITSKWKSDGLGNIIEYTTSVPANTNATLFIPIKSLPTIGETCIGVDYIGEVIHSHTKCMAFKLESGKFLFKLTDNTIFIESL